MDNRGGRRSKIQREALNRKAGDYFAAARAEKMIPDAFIQPLDFAPYILLPGRTMLHVETEYRLTTAVLYFMFLFRIYIIRFFFSSNTISYRTSTFFPLEERAFYV